MMKISLITICWNSERTLSRSLKSVMEQSRRLVASSDPVYARLTANSSRIVSRELFSTWRKLMVMDAPTIEARVKAYLDELDSESGHTGEVEVPFDRERMAEYLGVTRPSLSRALGHLRDQGLITWRKNVFKLKGDSVT